MTAVDLDRPWLHDPTDPDGALAFLFDGARAFGDTVVGEVRRMANGALRPVRRAGRQRTVQVRVSVDAAGYAKLAAWTGRTLLYRDGLGNKVPVVFFSTPWETYANGTARWVDLDLVEVTFSEAV